MEQDHVKLSETLHSWQHQETEQATATDDPPLRSELFSAAQMALHGKYTAKRHRLLSSKGRDRLLPRLADNAELIANTCNELTAAIMAGRQITPASEWLLDNFYLIEEQIRIARRHLPKHYSRELPRLGNEDAAEVPRVYHIALEIISHGDGRVDPESLARFVRAYQEESILKLGELWAIPIMLRLALIENLRRVCSRVADNRYQRDLANTWADQLVESAEKAPGNLIMLVADMARSQPPLSSGFVAELARRLQGQHPALTLALQWLSTRLGENGVSVEQLIQAEIGQQAADQVSVSNSIGSLRFLGTMDWQEFVETMSPVEQALRLDPGQTYARMDFATRDHYRHVVEKLARHCHSSELQVAELALQMAGEQRELAEGGLDARLRHVGYYLVGKGQAQLEQRLGVRWPPLDALAKAARRAPLPTYLGAIFAFTALFTAAALVRATDDDLSGWPLAAFLLLFAAGFSHLALALVNFMATQLTRPHPLPRMDFTDGIPPEARTLVAVPALIYSRENVLALCEGLEVRFLANRDANLRFCLLTDFTDAQHEHMPSDAELAALARSTIAEMNARYGPDQPFLLLHRPRRWNPSEQAWMGEERKRGKLSDLNGWLRGGARERFSIVEGEIGNGAEVRYVITLDADTLLPRDAARSFVATMAHPLNHPRVDRECRRVVEGYGILQPRVAVSLPREDASRYERLCGGEPGIDPYTRTVSDVYQDVFYEGSFIGKGIYDVDTFEQVLGGRLPDNRILSHDLLEGCYLRAGLLSDAQLYEENPSRYSDDVARRHRWIRGDWQLAGWLRASVPAAQGTREPNPLTTLSRWKLFDNLRRSLVPAVLMAMFVTAWTLLPDPGFWTGAVLAVILLAPLLASLLHLAEKPPQVLWRQHSANSTRTAGLLLGQALLSLVFLPYEAFFCIDAVVRTCWRMLSSHRHLLEWRASSLASTDSELDNNWSRMWFAPLSAGAIAVLLGLLNPDALLFAAPILLLWFLSPMTAWWISLPLETRRPTLAATQERFLHQLARRTWAFFEAHVKEEENWLPPDNFQEHPNPVTAHRTSPTNIGISLLANLAAWDFGYLCTGDLLERTGKTLATMERMERYNGHFYNWYDTLTLNPLHPMYISSVDSGNLAGHLLTLAPGLEQLGEAPILNARCFEGLATTLQLVASHAAGAQAGVHVAIATMERELGPAQVEAALSSLPAAIERLALLQQCADAIVQALTPAGEPVLQDWAKSLARQAHAAHDALLAYAPWMRHASEYVMDSSLTRIPTLRELAAFTLAGAASSDLAPVERARQQRLGQLAQEGSNLARAHLATLADLAQRTRALAHMDFTFLYSATTKLLAVGYNVSERRLDTSCYDLLASEIRLTSFVAIAQGQLPQEHWFALGRQLCIVAGQQVLLSWSGSMFEYLMPLLVMPNYPNTLLDQTYGSVMRAQIEYGRQREVPWGISESGYNTVDAALNYQYRAFGVPGLGMKRGLGDDLVVAPYASMLGLMVDADAACANLMRMEAQGFSGRYGFYEAIDFTPARLPRGQAFAVVRSFMAHHQGMGFLALAYTLLDRPMQRRFESDPLLQATLLVLQERVPKGGAFYANVEELAAVRAPVLETAMPMRILTQASTSQPEVQLLSNGHYHVMVSSAGGSSSRWRDLAVTRWRQDGTSDNWGLFCYVRDLDTGLFWSTTYQPTLADPKKYEVIFSEGRAEFRRHDRGLDLYTEIVVSPEDDIEMRRTRITNNSPSRRRIEFTSYAEVVLAPAAADNAHPAFSKLFVQTEILRQENAILCTRRPRSKEEQPPTMLHLVSLHDGTIAEASYETSRPHFLGRGRTASSPRAMLEDGPLGGHDGSVLDPVVAIRYTMVLEPEQAVTLDVVTGVTETRDAALHLIDKYQDRHLADRVFELAWTHSQVVLRQLNASEADAQLYGRLAGNVIYPSAAMRADVATLVRNQRGQSGLWAYAISGDLPIVLLQIKDPANIELVRQLVQAHAWWRLKGLVVDLVIWYEDQGGYRQVLHDQIMGLIASGIDAQAIDRPGGIFVRLLDQIAPEDRVLMQSVARVIVTDSKGTLAELVKRAAPAQPKLALLSTDPRQQHRDWPDGEVELPPLQLDNGIGGFSADGREYVVRCGPDRGTPAPWSNVLANPNFGSVVSESGQAYTWSENAHEFRLTPWENDPVSDRSGEAFYLRDDASGSFWSPTPLPAPGAGAYVTRHGFGYSVFEHQSQGIASTLTTFVALDASLKYSLLKVRNTGTAPRRLSAFGYVEWVLGDLREKSAMHIVTEIDPASGAVFARNAYNTEFTGRVGFFHVDAPGRSLSGDRQEFIGRNQSLSNPAAMRRVRLSGRVGAAIDPCAALCVPLELEPGEEAELVFILGVGGRRNADASGVILSYNGMAAAQAALAKVQAHWEHTLGAVQVATPDPALDVLANGWLMYQTIACRLWARSGYYQSGGAFGYRDQLQDTMAMVHAEPHLLREQLLLCAAHQFAEGDAQHWWHPPADRGVRTHCSDDYLWLPLAVHRYVQACGDTSVLTEPVPFLEGRALKPEEESYYDLPTRSAQSATLYEHCVRAIRHGLRFGEHGLPLIGTCDWNDGMDRVGNHGRGESVWLAWFLVEVLQSFAEVAERQSDAAFAAECRKQAAALAANVETNAWDGEWYRRAYFDDGTPLGSASNDECQIDSISQSWGVLSGAAMPERARSAMQKLDERLVRRDEGLVQLLDPPFDKGKLDPGYIRGYVPGVRENGGQYTHAAIWAAMAFARMGERDRAWELLRMVSPVHHAGTADRCETYKVEPYVMAADVYAVAPHVGRGGWTWYTGSSGWTYRLIVESLLGLQLEGTRLLVAPLLPADWDACSLRYRYRASHYMIRVTRGSPGMLVDGVAVQGNAIELSDDGAEHVVEVRVQV